jgi:hypothetical protein
MSRSVRDVQQLNIFKKAFCENYRFATDENEKLSSIYPTDMTKLQSGD